MIMALIAVVVFVLVTAGVFAVASLFDERRSHARLLRERLATVQAASERQPSEELLLLRDELMSDIPAFNRLLQAWPRMTRVQQLLSQADVKMKAGKFLLVTVCSCAMAAVVVLLLSDSTLFAAVAAAFGLFVPYMYVSFRRAQRFSKFEELFPEAIDTLARAVRAGHAFPTALELLATEMGEPVAGEFRKLFEEQKFGLPLRDALLNLAERVPIVDVKFFATAVMLQRETGGNLAEILDGLSYVIRERFKILRQVRVYTAQGRLTMLLLMALPPIIVVVMMVMNPGFMTPLFTDPIGHALIAAGIVLQTIGYLLIRKIIRIQV
jgi:tight adherence protein B